MWWRVPVVLLGAYKQIKSQIKHVFLDISEDNFDRAFELLRLCKTPLVCDAMDADEVHGYSHTGRVPHGPPF